MRLHFERQGGYAGLRLSHEVDVDALPSDTAAQVRELIDAARLLDATHTFTEQSSTRVPDAMIYRLQLEDGATSRTLQWTDVTAPADVKPLLALLSKLALTARG